MQSVRQGATFEMLGAHCLGSAPSCINISRSMDPFQDDEVAVIVERFCHFRNMVLKIVIAVGGCWGICRGSGRAMNLIPENALKKVRVFKRTHRNRDGPRESLSGPHNYSKIC